MRRPFSSEPRSDAFTAALIQISCNARVAFDNRKSCDVFPRHSIVVYDKAGRLADHALYFNALKCRLAHKRALLPQPNGFHYLYREDGSYRGVDGARGPFEVLQSYLSDDTFHRVSEERLREQATKKIPYEVLNAASIDEARYIRNASGARFRAIKRRYFWSYRDSFPSE